MNIVTSQISGFVHQVAPLPGQAWLPVRILCGVHWLWRWNYKKNLYSDPKNWIQLAAGHLANVCLGDGWLRTIAHIILITHRTRLYCKQVSFLAEDALEFSRAVRGKYVLVGAGKMRRIQLIQATFFKLMYQLYQVAMHSVEIYDAFYRREEAFNEVFINSSECINDFIKNNFTVSTYIKENKAIIQLLLSQSQIFVQVEELLQRLDKFI